ncbi:Glycosyltransferase involved in cell wall bisynthesis [Robiginitalea myxolifaciens]|uniref:Glycosyltransferase involved in cell wall bisynthesis n=1 Tax=Robiginitalea myxolifaciens TaxID=400055 RepID=A0A1I6H1U0_9FLAO|nr:glycosyltransferase [Robiginitalea myxolifaciens]SFR48423.1 Glycosyltransferase involved in cell wall bisynthesis [Robiginitalea myxolifaciens]
MIRVRYLSALCSEATLQYIFETSTRKPQLAAQKFHRLLAEGMGMLASDCTVETYSIIPVVRRNHSRIWWRLPGEKSRGVQYRYVPFINLPVLKNLGAFLAYFFSNIFWLLSGRKDQRVLICDALNPTLSLAAIAAAKITGRKCLGIVTDIPGMMVTSSESRQTFTGKLYSVVTRSALARFSGYILLTEAMSAVVNPKNRPYIIVEGLVDMNMSSVENDLTKKASPRVILYGGGLFAKYGVENLVLAFMKTSDPNTELHLYGSGAMEKDLGTYSAQDPRVIYHGLVPTNVVVNAQLEASLLVNPRPSSEEFTKYSFPSKNMEYMASGTPTLTTPLPGMPPEYKPFVYLFEGEDPEQMARKLEEVMSQSAQDLHEFGKQAKAFVLTHKNNKVQAHRVLEFARLTMGNKIHIPSVS